MSRKAGWYWARPSSEWVLPDQDWEPCELNENGQWVFLHYEKGWQLLDDSAFDEIGPRIPTPDEAPPIGQRYRNEAGEVVAVVVPAEPDWEMLAADGCRKHHEGQECLHHDNRRRIWRAMLDAIPEPSNT